MTKWWWLYAFADDAGVGNLEFDDENVLFMFGVRLRNVRGPGEEFAYGDDAQNHAYDTQRVGQCTAQRGVCLLYTSDAADE